MAHLSKMLDIDLFEMSYIGDSSGDIPGLELVGMAFAPSMLMSDEVAHVVTSSPSTSGVLEAYHWIIQHNLRV